MVITGRIRRNIAAALAALAWAAPAQAAQDVRACSVQGQVVDQRDAPVTAAQVEVVGTTTKVFTDGRGEFCVTGQLPAPFQVLVTAATFNPQLSDPLAGGRAEPVRLNVRLFARLSEYVVVDGRADRMVGVAQSASEGTINAAELAARPVLRSADLLEAVPGVVMTQHSTGGHAPIILLRGYNLDHGTDFATFLEGVPLSLPSHAHAQGYTDLNFLIPELIDRLSFSKGPYAAAVGDFGTAGAATIEMKRTTERPSAVFELGSFSQMRAMSAGSTAAAGGMVLGAIDVSHTDGPSARPDDFSRVRGMLRFSRGDRTRGWTASLFGYRASWFGSDGYPRRAFERGEIPRYGSLDTSDGGATSRFLGSVERRWSGPATISTLTAFGQTYDMDLFSNLTFQTVDPVRGDQIHQRDRRVSAGAAFSQSRAMSIGGRAGELRFGAQGRYDSAANALFNTVDRVPTEKVDDTGAVLPATMYDVAIDQLSIGPYVEALVSLADRARFTVGARVDGFAFGAGGLGVTATPRHQAVFSPKAGLVLGPWRATEFYVNAGRGFHSNHAAGVVLDGATPIVRTLGGEVGVRTSVVRGLQSSISLWGIDSASELVYVPEAGFTDASRPGRRYGIEWLNFWRPRQWLTVDLDVSFSEARYTTDPDGVGTHIPDSIAGVYSLGAAVENRRGWSGSLRGRYLGPRALTEDGSVRSTPSFVLNAQLGKSFGARWQVVAEAFNLANRRYDDITYYYATRLRDTRTGILESTATPDFVTHPAEPRSVRMKMAVKF
jgi:hypothetical protein